MMIQVENTPNPNTLKFLPGVVVNSGSEPLEFDYESITSNPPKLVSLLFGVENIIKVFLGDDFISVTKSRSIEWDVLKPEVLTIIMDYYTINSTDSISSSYDEHEDEEFYDEKDFELVKQIKELIEVYVRPAVAQDGGDIKFRGYNQGTVFVKLRGACSGCPSSSITLKQGIQSMLNYHIPCINSVEDVF